MMPGRSRPRTVIAWVVTLAVWQPSGRVDPGQVAGGREDLVEQRRRQAAGEGVVLRRVVAAEQRDAAVLGSEVPSHAVPETRPRLRYVVPRAGQAPQGAFPAVGTE